MTGERCRHCGGRIEYVDAAYVEATACREPWWVHVHPAPAWPAHEPAPAFGGGS